jgi:TfoX/Sxy family transcriptional regulator of competence genes
MEKKLFKYSCPKLSSAYDVKFKNCFGATAGYIRGRIFISCGKFGVALKLPQKVLDELFKKRGAKRLKYFANGHVKKEYAVLPQRILKNKNQFKKLVDESVKYVLS